MSATREHGYFSSQIFRPKDAIQRHELGLERRYRRLALLVFAFLALVSPAVAAETASAPTAEKAPPASISVSDVTSEAESVSSALRDIDSDLSYDRSSQNVAQQLPVLTREIDARMRESRKLLGQSPSVEMLVELEQVWLRVRRELAEVNGSVTGRLSEIGRFLAQIDQFTGVWEQTLTSAKEASAPPEILERIENVRRDLKQERDAVDKQRSSTLMIQSRLGVQDARIAEMLRTLSRSREHVLDRLFVRDGVPLWSGALRSQDAQDLQQEGINSFTAQSTALKSYATRNVGRVALGIVVFFALAGGLYWARARARQLFNDADSAVLRTSVLARPIAAALLLSLLGSRWIYAQAPRLLWVLLSALALVPSVMIVERLITPALRTLPYALIAFFFVDQLRLLVAAMPFLPRLLFLVEMLGAVVLSLWLLRSPARCQLWVSETPVPHRWPTLVSYTALGISLAAFLANVSGYLTLANLLGNGLLQSGFLALVLYAFVLVLDELAEMVLEARSLAVLSTVRLHRALLRRRLRRILNWLAFVLWVLGTLQQLLLRDFLFNAVRDFLNAELSFGSISFSLGDVLGFAATVWAAFAISRLIRFLLEEDIYPRVRLKRGISYAISSTLHYAILVAGFFFAMAALGIDMTRVTILAGAFGVGVGFGLQNIFNNFISGLIVLFERPINIGDVIQVEDASGVVERIGIRASVIRTVNGSEVIVPNGKLISERLTNWTLSSRQHGIELPISVEQGTDPKRVIATLEKAAAGHPLINKDPSPKALVVKLGPDSLGLELRAWTDQSEQWMQIRSDLAIAVSQALAAEKIALK